MAAEDIDKLSITDSSGDDPMHVEIQEIVDPDDNVSFVNAVIAVIIPANDICQHVSDWIKQDYEKYPHIRFYTLNAKTYNPNKFPDDKVLSARVKKIEIYPTFLLYHNNHLTATVQGWGKDDVINAIGKFLRPINEKKLRGGSEVEWMKTKFVPVPKEEREKGPLSEQPPLSSDAHQVDMSVYYDKYIGKKYT